MIIPARPHRPPFLECPFDYVMDITDCQASRSDLQNRVMMWHTHFGLSPHHILFLLSKDMEKAKGCSSSHFDDNVAILTIINK